MSSLSPLPIRSQPGVTRDGTALSSDTYSAAQWARFQRGLPRKIGGYRSINKFLTAMPRAVHEYALSGLSYVHTGAASKLERLTIDSDFNTSVVTDRTPAGLTASTSNLWQMTTGAIAATPGTNLVAQVAPNLVDLSNGTGGQLFYGDLFGTAALVVATLPAAYSVTGGVTYLAPYTFAFGSSGFVMWSPSCSDFTIAGAGNAYVTGQKIVRGLPLRAGGGNSPAGLFWSLDSLVRATYIGGTPIFQFDTLAGQSSILSAASVVEYDGTYFWLGTDRMMMFNGVVREIPNSFNLDFFYDSLNRSQAQKVFAFKVPRFGEIWWCFPKDDATEPNHAIIFNVRENSWYDTALPNSGRGAAVYAPVLSRPLMGGVEPQDYIATGVTITAAGAGYAVGNVLTVTGGTRTIAVALTVTTVGGGGTITGVSISNAGSYTATPTNPVAVTGGAGTGATFTLAFTAPYKLWVHEEGTDQIDGSDEQPVLSYFETGDLALPLSPTQPLNRSIQVAQVELDFVQTGDMTISVLGRQNARGPDVASDPVTFTPDTQTVPVHETRRQIRFRFESNVIGGDYQMGLPIAHIQPSDGRITP